TRNYKNRQSLSDIEFAEDVARKQRQFHFFDAIRPSPPATVHRQVLFQTFVSHLPSDELLKTRPQLNPIPPSFICLPGHFASCSTTFSVLALNSLQTFHSFLRPW